jgi:hypothetical protein
MIEILGVGEIGMQLRAEKIVYKLFGLLKIKQQFDKKNVNL